MASTVTWLIMLGRFGRLLFSLAIIGIGVETLICSYVSSHSLGPHYKVVPVIPWVPAIPSLLHRTSRYLLAFALIVFGIAHFQVLTFIASLVPGWIPWHRFWTVFFGVAFISAGVSFATGCLQRWAALGVGLMFALWTVTIHLPPVLATPDPDKWSDVFIVVALWGGFWALVRDLRDLRDRKDLSLGTGSNRA